MKRGTFGVAVGVWAGMQALHPAPGDKNIATVRFFWIMRVRIIRLQAGFPVFQNFSKGL